MPSDLTYSLRNYLDERRREASGEKREKTPLFRREGQRERGAIKKPGRRYGGQRPRGFMRQVLNAHGPADIQAVLNDLGKNQYKTVRTQMTRGGLPSGINKPFGRVLWTSTFVDSGPRGPRSAWTKWASQERPQWLVGGTLELSVRGSARVLHFLKKNEYFEVVEDPKFRLEHPTEGGLLNWRELAYEGYDGVHVQEPLIIHPLRMWMVETTAWFNWAALKVESPLW